MYKNIRNIVLLSTVSLFSFANVHANEYQNETYQRESKFALGAKIGSQGLGLEGRFAIKENFFARLGANYFFYNINSDEDEIKFKGKLTLLTTPIMLDFHPIDGSGFRLSAGVAYNGNQIKVSAEPTQNVTIFNHTYTPQDLGKITATLSHTTKVAPIISIGYDSSLISDNGFSFNMELGAMYAGKAKVDLAFTGLAQVATNLYPQISEDLNKQVNKSLDKVQKYLKFYPILSFGFKYSL